MAHNVCVTPGNPYHMSRLEIVDWINETLQMKIKSIGELGAGAHFCQLMDMMFPGTISMRKVKWSCRHDREKSLNFKLLQESFERLAIDKIVPINDLIKGNLKANLEFVQWFVLLFDANYEVHDYDPAKERSRCQTPGVALRPRSRKSLHNPKKVAKSLNLAKDIDLSGTHSPQSSIVSSNSYGSRAKSPFQRRIQRSLAEHQIQGELDGLKNELKHFKTVLQSVEEQRQYELKKMISVEDLCATISAHDPLYSLAQTILNIIRSVEPGYEVPNNNEDWPITLGSNNRPLSDFMPNKEEVPEGLLRKDSTIAEFDVSETW